MKRNMDRRDALEGNGRIGLGESEVAETYTNVDRTRQAWGRLDGSES